MGVTPIKRTYYPIPLSPRGKPVVISRRPKRKERSVFTVELYEKWYGLIIVHPGGSMEEIPFPTLESFDDGVGKIANTVGEIFGEDVMTPYVDHIPNPHVVKQFAKAKDYYLDELAFELMTGRWALR